jgi:hypothetical protein
MVRPLEGGNTPVIIESWYESLASQERVGLGPPSVYPTLEGVPSAREWAEDRAVPVQPPPHVGCVYTRSKAPDRR